MCWGACLSLLCLSLSVLTCRPAGGFLGVFLLVTSVYNVFYQFTFPRLSLISFSLVKTENGFQQAQILV